MDIICAQHTITFHKFDRMHPESVTVILADLRRMIEEHAGRRFHDDDVVTILRRDRFGLQLLLRIETH